MLLLVGIALIILWLIGVMVFPVIGWFIHILLVIAVIMFLLRVIRGK